MKCKRGIAMTLAMLLLIAAMPITLLAEDIVTASEPQGATAVSEPQDATTAPESVDATVVSEPQDATTAPEPVDATVVSKSQDATAVSEPQDATAVSKSQDATAASEPQDATAASESQDATAASEPVDQPMAQGIKDASESSAAKPMAATTETGTLGKLEYTVDSEETITIHLIDGVLQYSVVLPLGTNPSAEITILGGPTHAYDEVVISSAIFFLNQGAGSVSITVRAEDGNTNTYIIGFTKAKLDTTPIDDALGEANNIQNGVQIFNRLSTEVDAGVRFVSAAESEDLKKAINTAIAAKNNATTVNHLKIAAEALTRAVALFNTLIKTGSLIPPADAKSGIVVDFGNQGSYAKEDGTWATSWEVTDDEWYLFSPERYMNTGWKWNGTSWDYLKDNGPTVTGWLQIEGNWYYCTSSGAMATGWLQMNDNWYYFSSSSAMVTGWAWDGTAWYYLDSNGAMTTGWLQNNGMLYYLHSNGVMATGIATVDGVQHNFSSNGMWLGRWTGKFVPSFSPVLIGEGAGSSKSASPKVLNLLIDLESVGQS